MSIEEHIQRAMQEGKFENLPGKGKPLRLDDISHVDPEWRVAYHLLQSNGFTLPWIQTRQEIETDLEAARAVLRRTWEWRRTSLDSGKPAHQVEPDWQQAVQAFHEKSALLNKRIFNYNLEAPSGHFQRRAINAEKEIRAITGE